MKPSLTVIRVHEPQAAATTACLVGPQCIVAYYLAGGLSVQLTSGRRLPTGTASHKHAASSLLKHALLDSFCYSSMPQYTPVNNQ